MSAPPVAHVAVEAKCDVLGSILMDDARVFHLCTDYGIVPESFAIEQHRQVYRAFIDLHKTGAPIDLLTSVDRLRTTGKPA